MKYTLNSIENGVANVTYADGSWAEFIVASDMGQADIDDLAYQFKPKTGSNPDFLINQVGIQRDATAKPEEVAAVEEFVDERPQWLIDRTEAYGTLESQIEYITENGLEAWQTHVAQIKADNPKPTE